MNVPMRNRKYTIEYCQQYIGQIIGCFEILNIYYKQVKENMIRTYATCRCTRCGEIAEKDLIYLLCKRAHQCRCVIAEQQLYKISLAHEVLRNKPFNYNKWEYIDQNTVRVYFKDGTYFIADLCSWIWLRRFVWFKAPPDSHSSTNRRTVETEIHGGRFTYYSLLLPIPPGNEYVRDHINQNALDNRYNNLRVVDQRANILNSPRFNNETSKFAIQYPIGVYEQDGRYYANICIHGNRTTKAFNTLEEAIEQRRIWEQECTQIVPLEVPRLFLPDGTLNLQNFRFDWYSDRFWIAWNHLGINLLPVPKQEYLRYMPTKDVIDFGYNGVYL